MCGFKDICDICGNDHEDLGDDQICSSCKAASRKIRRYTPSNNVQEYRKLAKEFGGKALTGTAKQKEWAEKIRADFIKNTSKDDDFIKQCVVAYTSAKTWIEHREKFASL